MMFCDVLCCVMLCYDVLYFNPLTQHPAPNYHTLSHTIPPPPAAASIIITMLPATAHVAGVLQGPEGVFANGTKGALIIDCSTIDPVASRQLSKEAQEHGFRMIDAPVSGGVTGAEAGTLTFMVGGAAGDVEAAKETLSLMGKNTIHCGEAGSGGNCLKATCVPCVLLFPVLPCPAMPYPALPCLALLVLPYPTLPCPTLPYPTLPCPTLLVMPPLLCRERQAVQQPGAGRADDRHQRGALPGQGSGRGPGRADLRHEHVHRKVRVL
jgi:hypothetical protein